MPKYRVRIQRVEYRAHDFFVEAADADEAEVLAIEESYDYNFLNSPVGSADEEVVAIEECH